MGDSLRADEAPLIALLVGSMPMIAFFLEILVRRTAFGFVRPENCITLFVAVFLLPFELATVVYCAWSVVRLGKSRLVAAVLGSAIVLIVGGGLALLLAVEI